MSKEETQMVAQIEKAMETFLKEDGNANILVVGATGVGKSALVNKVFGVDFSKVGTGKPVTQETTRYTVKDMPITLFDTKGYELASEEHSRFLKEMQLYMNDSAKKINDQVHIVWYCIAAPNSRVTDMDIAMIEQFMKTGKPVAVIFTKSDMSTMEDIEAMAATLAPTGVQSFYVSTQFDQGGNFQLGELMTWTYEQMEPSVKYAFLRAQRANVDLVKKEVNKAIRQHAAASFAVGFTPIPFADGPLLLANQSAMIGRIMKQYRLDSDFENISMIVSALGAGTIVSNLGRYLVAQLTKFIPGAGSVINGSVATAITVSLGFTISEICYRIAKKNLSGEDVTAFVSDLLKSDEVKQLFDEFFKKEMDDQKKKK
ncbi:YcjF family protein [Kurthia massiliensis]|uniref:YcjF family protein n=1 Tax=Kurthia massiliensis TaxID=1033739 RepID=UPI000288379F|nr:GTPase [Kurthia massiliensis]